VRIGLVHRSQRTGIAVLVESLLNPRVVHGSILVIDNVIYISTLYCYFYYQTEPHKALNLCVPG
jgi:hypothetical protein